MGDDTEAADARLTELEHQIAIDFAGLVTVTKEPASWSTTVLVTEVVPVLPDRCGIWWWVDEDEIQCGIGKFSSWELSRDLESVSFIEQLLGAVSNGQVTEHTGMNDVVVRLRTADGRKLRFLEISKGELFRLPWNRKRRYLPWRPPS